MSVLKRSSIYLCFVITLLIWLIKVFDHFWFWQGKTFGKLFDCHLNPRLSLWKNVCAMNDDDLRSHFFVDIVCCNTLKLTGFVVFPSLYVLLSYALLLNTNTLWSILLLTRTISSLWQQDFRLFGTKCCVKCWWLWRQYNLRLPRWSWWRLLESLIVRLCIPIIPNLSI